MSDPAGVGEEFLSLEILRVGATPEANGRVKLAIATSRGEIPGVLHPHQGGEGAVIWVSGAIGGLNGPAGGIYATLSDELVEAGLTSLRLDYRMAGELEECVLDTLAGVSVLSGLGAERIALVGHSSRKRDSRPSKKWLSGAYMGKPRSASVRAGASTASRLQLPKRSSRRHQASSAAGTVAASRPSQGMRSRPSARMRSIVAAAGAVPCPERV